MRKISFAFARAVLLSFILFISHFIFTPLYSEAKILYQEIPQPLVPNAPIQITLEHGDVIIELRRIDFWDGYIVFVGTGKVIDGSACIARTDFSLQLGNIQYEAANREQTRQSYNIDAPGTGFFTQCLSSSEEIVLLPFVAPVNQIEAVIQYENRLYKLPSSLQALKLGSDTPQPTSTSTPTPTGTPTPTATPTFTPAPVEKPDGSSVIYSLPLPSSANFVLRSGTVSNQGIKFIFERVDFWDKLPDGTQPRNDIFVVFTGTLSGIADGTTSHCVGAGDVILFIGQQEYEIDDMRSANQFYQSDYPGYILPQCVVEGETATTFFVFDVDLVSGQVFLSLNKALLQLDVAMVDLASESSTSLATTNITTSSESDKDNTPTSTQAPTKTSAQTPVKAPIQAPTQAPTKTPTQVPTEAPTKTPTDALVVTRVVNRNANLRAGPGTSFAIVGSATTGDVVIVVGKNAAGDWYQLSTEGWIAAFLVDQQDASVPTRTRTPAPTSTPSPTFTATATGTPLPINTAIPTTAPDLNWWEGGTLHSSTVAQWKAAEPRNQLATAADWAAVGFDLHSLRDIEFYANELLTCIETAIDAYETAYGESGSMTDMAVLCVVSMKGN